MRAIRQHLFTAEAQRAQRKRRGSLRGPCALCASAVRGLHQASFVSLRQRGGAPGFFSITRRRKDTKIRALIAPLL